MSAVIVHIPIIIVMSERRDNICVILRAAIRTEDTAYSVGSAGGFGNGLSVALSMRMHLERLCLKYLVAAGAVTAHLTVMVCGRLKIDLPDSFVMTECVNSTFISSFTAASAEENLLSIFTARGLCDNYPSSVIVTESVYRATVDNLAAASAIASFLALAFAAGL